MFLKRAECRPLVPKNVNRNLLLLFNTCPMGLQTFSKLLSSTFALWGILRHQLPSRPKNQSSIFNEGLNILKSLSASYSLAEFKKAFNPDTFVRLALHLISHGNYTVLKFLLNEKLCRVTEGMLLQVVNAYDIRKTSGSD